MYEAFFGMTHTPFTRDLPPECLYETKAMSDVLGRLMYVADKKLFAVITSEPGCGCILSIGNPQNCHQNSLFLEREFLVFVRTRFLHSEVLSGASMHAASDNFSRRT